MGIGGRALGNARLVEGANTDSAPLIDMAFNPAELRDDKGRWVKVPGTGTGKAGGSLMPGPRKSQRIRPVITAAEARGNSRPVSMDEFQHLAAKGNQQIDKMKRDSSPLTGLDQYWGAIKGDTFDEVQKPWGGATIDGHTGTALPQGADKYALSVKPGGMHSISIPENASYPDYSRAMDEAKDTFRPVLERRSFYLGIFHDDEQHRIDLDPVAVVDSIADVESIGAYTRAIGGAYHFKSGDGFWPPHVAEGAAGLANTDTTHFAGPGQWRSQAEAVQAPEPEDEGEDEPPTIFQLAFHPDELRDFRGRWTRGRTEQMHIGKLLRAAADPFVGAPIPNEQALDTAVVAETTKAANIVPRLLGGSHEEWDGEAELYRNETKPHILAEMEWNGTLSIADNVAAAIKDASDRPDDPVRYPDAFEVLEHEMIHGVVPEGSAARNKRAYQVFALSQIEEGFTELGAIHHAAEFMDQMGLGDRQARTFPGHTVKEMAETINNPDEIHNGNAWGHYPQQTKDAQDWVQQVVQQENLILDSPQGKARIVELTNEINRMGADGKVPVMSRQLATAMVADEPKMRNDQKFLDEMIATIMEAILKQWNTDNPEGAAKQAFGAAKTLAFQKVAEKQREMAEAA
jgi:hypothetical protein